MDEREGRKAFIVFHVRGLPYACRLEEVKEIISAKELSPLPNARDNVVGLRNLRGEVVPVVDLERVLFPPPYNENASRVLVIDQEEFSLGFSVESVDRIEELDPEHHTLTPAEDSPPFIKETLQREDSIPVPVVEMELLASQLELEGRGFVDNSSEKKN